MIRRLFIIPIVLGLMVLGSGTVAETGRDFPAEVLNEELTFKIDNDGKAEYTVKREIKVYTSEGDGYAALTINESSFARFRGFSAKTFNAAGDKIESYKKSDGTEVCGYSGFALYQDVCIWIYWLNAQTYPYTFEYEYKMEYNSLFFWPNWSPQRLIPVKSSILTLITPAGFEFDTDKSGDIPEATIIDKGDKTVYVYQMTDIPPVEDEEYIYSLGENLLTLKFAPHNYMLGDHQFTGADWTSLSSDCQAMWDGCFTLNDRQKALVDSIASRAASQREICDQIHKALSKTTRYVAIEVGIGGWRPTPTADTFERGYGDCKDLATLYVSMLRHAEIDAWPVLIQSKGFNLTDRDFPSLRFNHSIFYAVVDGDTLWSDPTCSFCEMGDLPWQDEDIYALSINAEGGSLVKTSPSPAHDNCIVRKAEIKTAKGKTLTVAYELSATGNCYHNLQGFLSYSEHDKLEKYLTVSDFGLSKKMKPDTAYIESDATTGRARRVVVEGTIRNAVQTAGTKKYVNLTCFLPLREREKVDLKKRTLPLDLLYPFSYADTVHFTVPRGWEIAKLPDPVDIEDEFGTMRVEFSLVEKQLTVVCHRECFAYFVSPEQFPQYAAYLEKIEDAIPSHIAMVKK